MEEENVQSTLNLKPEKLSPITMDHSVTRKDTVRLVTMSRGQGNFLGNTYC